MSGVSKICANKNKLICYIKPKVFLQYGHASIKIRNLKCMESDVNYKFVHYN